MNRSTHNSLPQQATVALGKPKAPSSTERLSSGNAETQRLTVADLSLDDLSGREFAQYDLGKRIGQGGMGQVYLAKHRHLGKSVAIKFIRHDLVCREAQTRFLQEIQAVGKLTHPHLIHAIDAGELDGLLYCVTEYMEGRDLYEWVHLRGPMPPRAAAEVIRQAALGLQYAHQQGFVHRDIKPSNLFLESHGNIRVLDFGLAFHSKQQPDLTSQGQLLGTVDFISPEQARHAHSATPQSDLYSLGASLIYLLSERPPFPDEQYPSLTNKLVALTTSLPPFFSQSANLPAPIRDVLQRTLNIEPNQRFRAARDLANAFESYASVDELATWMIHGSGGRQPSVNEHRANKSAYRVWGAVAATASAAIPLIAYFAWNSSSSDSEMLTTIQPVSHTTSTSEGAADSTSSLASEPVQPAEETSTEPAESNTLAPFPRRPLRQLDGRPTISDAKTIVHQSGSSRNARAIGAPGKKMSEAISNRKGTP